MALIEALALAVMLQTPAAEPTAPPTELIMQNAAAIQPQASSPFAKSLLAGFGFLQPHAPTVVWYNKETRTALPAAEASKMTEAQLTGYTKRDVDDNFYYFTRYGTPVAFVRPVEILGKAGVKGADGLKLVDFGFGSIGQLRALAYMGADVTGIEVNPILQVIYAREPGQVTRCAAAGKGKDGSISLAFGQFPKEPAMVKKVGGGYDVFISKSNTQARLRAPSARWIRACSCTSMSTTNIRSCGVRRAQAGRFLSHLQSLSRSVEARREVHTLERRTFAVLDRDVHRGGIQGARIRCR